MKFPRKSSWLNSRPILLLTARLDTMVFFVLDEVVSYFDETISKFRVEVTVLTSCFDLARFFKNGTEHNEIHATSKYIRNNTYIEQKFKS